MDTQNMTALPANLMFGASVLSSYNRNRFRLETTSSDTGSAGRIITVNLPENALLDMKSFRFFFDAVASSNSTGNASNHAVGLLPAHASSLISRVEVYVNGVQVQQGTSEYNTIYNVLNIPRANRSLEESQSRLLHHPSISSATSNSIADKLDTAGERARLCVSNWLGFLNETSTRFLPTDLLGQIQVRLTFAPNGVLSACGSNTTASELSAGQQSNATSLTYTTSNMFFTVDSIVVGDTYNQLLRNKLMGQGSFIPLNYKEYYTFTNDGLSSANYTTRFSLSAGSIDKMYAVQRATGFDTIGLAVNNNPTSDSNESVLEHVGQNALVGKYFAFIADKDGSDDADGTLRYQWTVNNVQHPQYQARNSEAMADIAYCQDKLGFGNVGTMISSPSTFCRSMAVYTLQLNHPELGISVQSGYNSRGINSTLSFAMSGVQTTNKQNMVVVETTSQLRISAGKALAVSF